MQLGDGDADFTRSLCGCRARWRVKCPTHGAHHTCIINCRLGERVSPSGPCRIAAVLCYFPEPEPAPAPAPSKAALRSFSPAQPHGPNVTSSLKQTQTQTQKKTQESEDHVPSEDEEETPEGLVCPGRESLKDEVETTRGKYCLQAE
mgnify:CR=1 FL=1